jgi:translation elongation factor EF-1beta|tara:strand:- start:172 stop:666 length:495 start_codon:yes stop_codon:yes gene_type:complete
MFRLGGGADAGGDDEDDFDMFGDNEEDLDMEEIVNDMGETRREALEAAPRRARMEQARLAKEKADGKKVKKEKPAERSLIALEVKPWEADTDLKMVWNEIKKQTQDGLVWGEAMKLEEMAFGIKKLVMTCVIEDAKVLMDDVTDKIEGLEQWVQSVQVASMNKL